MAFPVRLSPDAAAALPPSCWHDIYVRAAVSWVLFPVRLDLMPPTYTGPKRR